MWDTMIAKVKKVIYTKEKKNYDEQSTFFSTVQDILVVAGQKATHLSFVLHIHLIQGKIFVPLIPLHFCIING